MGVFLDIESALETKLAGISGAPKIQWENDASYKPTIGTPFWRPTNIPFKSDVASNSMLQKHQGIYHVDVFGVVNKGVGGIIGDLDKIYTAFNSVISLTSGSSRVDIQNVSRGKIVNEDAWCHGFIEINYVCYAH